MIIYRSRIYRQEDGLTIIELVIALAVLGFIIAALYSFYLAGLKSWNRSIEHMEYQQTARIAMNKIIKELKFAHQIEYGIDGGPVSINEPSDMIYFRTYVQGNSTRHSFRLKGNQLLFDRRGDCNTIRSANVVALNITGLVFKIVENEKVSVTIMVGDGSHAVTLDGGVRPRKLP